MTKEDQKLVIQRAREVCKARLSRPGLVSALIKLMQALNAMDASERKEAQES